MSADKFYDAAWKAFDIAVGRDVSVLYRVHFDQKTNSLTYTKVEDSDFYAPPPDICEPCRPSPSQADLDDAAFIKRMEREAYMREVHADAASDVRKDAEWDANKAERKAFANALRPRDPTAAKRSLPWRMG